ncbi:MAG: galactose-1-phosphate uridylyltransferase, partial [Oscillospiraceae bacterium]|nr:galactose-1-phosphate uridylyltransferase [Oscillospiraceae bacterium]
MREDAVKPALLGLLDYAEEKGLIEACDRTYCENRLLQILQLDSPAGTDKAMRAELPELLQVLIGSAVRRGVIRDGVVAEDLFDSLVMDVLTPYPHEVRRRFAEKLQESPQAATDWFYQFSCDTNYIRRDRIARDRKWICQGPYGSLDITINLSKPEKDPRAIAAAKLLPQTAYPKCQLCAENEGYAGRLNHPGRSNHRLIPLTIAGESWFFQYSPYVYYNEHCIVFNSRHTPMKIDR